MPRRGRTESRSRSSERRHPTVRERIGRAIASSLGATGHVSRSASEGVGAAHSQHGDGNRGSWGTTERFGLIVSCHSCTDTLATKLAKRCRACGHLSHDDCFEDCKVSESYMARMCLFCAGRVTTQISVVKSVMDRFAMTWDTDKWWLYLVDLEKNSGFHEHPGNNMRFDLEVFLLKALRERMVWEEVVDTSSSSDEQSETQGDSSSSPSTALKQEESPPGAASEPQSHPGGAP